MKTFCFIALFSCLSLASSAQYWQQEVNYSIDVRLNDKNHSLKGEVNIEYFNQSPDTLSFIWFHLWPNAYKNNETAFAIQLQNEAGGKKRLNKFKDRGFIDSLEFTVAGKKAIIEKHPDYNDVVKLILPHALAPGGKIHIHTPFYVDLPEYISRSGHQGNYYMVCQWYPKPAVYDHKGWHPMPYLDHGEYYSEFGSFDVSITLPSSYIVGATGTLTNKEELNQYRAIGTKNREDGSRKNSIAYRPPAAAEKTLRYQGKNIPDFAWFANKHFVIRYDTLQLNDDTVDVFTYHLPDGNRLWTKSTDYVKTATRYYSNWVGSYAYPVVQAVEGPANDMSGGMEYPMITLITSPNASEEELDGVIAHEVGHNWFMCMLGSNERDHAWMDEGLNSYLQFRYEAEKYRFNSVFGKYLPSEYRSRNFEEFQAILYEGMNKIPMESPIDIPSGSFPNSQEYGVVSYVKTAIWMYVMELHIGKDRLDQAIKNYFKEWKFRHPYPEDLKRSFEKTLNENMDKYFILLQKKGSL